MLLLLRKKTFANSIILQKLRDWTEHQWKLEAERMRALQDRDTAFDNLMGEIKSKLRSDNDFHLNVSLFTM